MYIRRTGSPGRQWHGLLSATLLLLLLAPLAGRPPAGAAQQAPLQDPSWSAPLNLSQSGGRSTFPSVVAPEPGADLLALWVEYTDDPRGEVMSRTRLGSSGSWAGTVNLSASPQADEGAAIYADGLGRVHAAWTGRDVLSGSDLLYRRWEQGDWSAPEILDHTATYHPSPYGLFFVEDITGTLYLFVTIGSGVTHTRLQQGSWEPLAPWIYVPGMRRLGAIVAGPDGRFHVAAFGQNQGNLSGCDAYLDDAYYTTTDGSTWEVLVNLAYTGTIAYDVGMAYDSGGNLHFFWSDISPPCSLDSERSAVYERVLMGTTWTERQEVTLYNTDQAVEDLALQVDPTGQLHLAWSEGLLEGSRAIQLSIRYRRWDGADWGKEEVVWESDADSINVDLALYKGIFPVLLWEEGPSDAEDVYFSERWRFDLYLPRVDRSWTGRR